MKNVMSFVLHNPNVLVQTMKTYLKWVVVVQLWKAVPLKDDNIVDLSGGMERTTINPVVKIMGLDLGLKSEVVAGRVVRKKKFLVM